MNWDNFLPLLVTACASLAFIAGLVRFLALFAAPYMDPSESAVVWRGPRVRTRLFLLTIGTLIAGALITWALILAMKDDFVPVVVKLMAYLGVHMVGASCIAVIGFAVSVQKRLAQGHSAQIRPNDQDGQRHIWNPDLLEMFFLVSFSVMVVIGGGFRPIAFGSVAALPFHDIEQRAAVIRVVVFWAFFAGEIALAATIYRAFPGSKTSIPVCLAVGLPLLGGIFHATYGDIAPAQWEIEAFFRDRGVTDGGQPGFGIKIAKVEALSLIGLSSVLVLLIAPLLDRIAKTFASDRPDLWRSAGFVLICLSLLALRAGSRDTDLDPHFQTFAAASIVGVLFIMAVPRIWQALQRLGLQAVHILPAGIREFGWAMAIFLCLALTVWAIFSTDDLLFTAGMLSAAATAASGVLKGGVRQPKPAIAAAH